VKCRRLQGQRRGPKKKRGAQERKRGRSERLPKGRVEKIPIFSRTYSSPWGKRKKWGGKTEKKKKKLAKIQKRPKVHRQVMVLQPKKRGKAGKKGRNVAIPNWPQTNLQRPEKTDRSRRWNERGELHRGGKKARPGRGSQARSKDAPIHGRPPRGIKKKKEWKGNVEKQVKKTPTRIAPAGGKLSWLGQEGKEKKSPGGACDRVENPCLLL